MKEIRCPKCKRLFQVASSARPVASVVCPHCGVRLRRRQSGTKPTQTPRPLTPPSKKRPEPAHTASVSARRQSQKDSSPLTSSSQSVPSPLKTFWKEHLKLLGWMAASALLLLGGMQLGQYLLADHRFEWVFASKSKLRCANSLQSTPDDGYVVAGNIMFSAAQSNVWAAKLDQDGEKEWEEVLNRSYRDSINDICVLADGSYVLAGMSEAMRPNTGEAWMFKLDVDGGQRWEYTKDTWNHSSAQAIHATSDGGCIVVGTEYENMGYYGLYDRYAWALKFDASGMVEWERRFEHEFTMAETVLEPAPGMYLIAGSIAEHRGEGWLCAFTAEGETLWERRYSEPGEERLIHELAITPDGGYIGIGGVNPSWDRSWDRGDRWLFKLDAQGKMVWERTFASLDSPDNQPRKVFESIQVAPDGGYVLTGYTILEMFGVLPPMSYEGPGFLQDSGLHQLRTDAWILKLNAEGNLEWEQKFGTGVANDVHLEPDGGYVIAGHLKSGKFLRPNPIVFKFKPEYP